MASVLEFKRALDLLADIGMIVDEVVWVTMRRGEDLVGVGGSEGVAARVEFAILGEVVLARELVAVFSLSGTRLVVDDVVDGDGTGGVEVRKVGCPADVVNEGELEASPRSCAENVDVVIGTT